MEQANEIQETLARSYALPDEIDEADLEAGARLAYTAMIRVSQLTSRIELDALELEEEEEGPTYLSDLNKVPDFIDEPPVEEVCRTNNLDSMQNIDIVTLVTAEARGYQGNNLVRLDVNLLYYIFASFLAWHQHYLTVPATCRNIEPVVGHLRVFRCCCVDDHRFAL